MKKTYITPQLVIRNGRCVHTPICMSPQLISGKSASQDAGMDAKGRSFEDDVDSEDLW